MSRAISIIASAVFCVFSSLCAGFAVQLLTGLALAARLVAGSVLFGLLSIILILLETDHTERDS